MIVIKLGDLVSSSDTEITIMDDEFEVMMFDLSRIKTSYLSKELLDREIDEMKPIYGGILVWLKEENKKMSKEEFKLELDKHNLTVNEFLDLRDAWYKLDASERLELLKNEDDENDKRDLYLEREKVLNMNE